MDALDNLASSLNALTIKIDTFDGSSDSNPTQFVASLRRYIRATGKMSPAQIYDENAKLIPNPDKDLIQKETLRVHLRDAAKSWFDRLPEDTSFEDCLTQLEERFKISEHRKHVKKVAVYQATQKPTESFSQYVTRVLDSSFGLGMSETDLLTIVTQGAHPSIRNFLLIREPTSLNALMALPLAHSGPGGTSETMEFVGATSFQPEVQDKTTKPDVNSQVIKSFDVDQADNDPDEDSARQRHNDSYDFPRRQQMGRWPFIPRRSRQFDTQASGYSRSPGRGDGYSRTSGRSDFYSQSPEHDGRC